MRQPIALIQKDPNSANPQALQASQLPVALMTAKAQAMARAMNRPATIFAFIKELCHPGTASVIRMSAHFTWNGQAKRIS